MADRPVPPQSMTAITVPEETAGPFSAFLQPHDLPRQSASGDSDRWNTGWQGAAGNTAYMVDKFIQGVTLGRTQKYLAEERDRLRNYQYAMGVAAERMNDPTLSPEGQRIARQAYDRIVGESLQSAASGSKLPKDHPQHGILHTIKSIGEQLTGGPMKRGKEIDPMKFVGELNRDLAGKDLSTVQKQLGDNLNSALSKAQQDYASQHPDAPTPTAYQLYSNPGVRQAVQAYDLAKIPLPTSAQFSLQAVPSAEEARQLNLQQGMESLNRRLYGGAPAPGQAPAQQQGEAAPAPGARALPSAEMQLPPGFHPRMTPIGGEAASPQGIVKLPGGTLPAPKAVLREAAEAAAPPPGAQLRPLTTPDGVATKIPPQQIYFDERLPAAIKMEVKPEKMYLYGPDDQFYGMVHAYGDYLEDEQNGKLIDNRKLQQYGLKLQTNAPTIRSTPGSPVVKAVRIGNDPSPKMVDMRNVYQDENGVYYIGGQVVHPAPATSIDLGIKGMQTATTAASKFAEEKRKLDEKHANTSRFIEQGAKGFPLGNGQIIGGYDKATAHQIEDQWYQSATQQLNSDFARDMQNIFATYGDERILDTFLTPDGKDVRQVTPSPQSGGDQALRNNNPMNLKVPGSKTDFQSFDSPQAGFTAGLSQIKKRIRENPDATLRDLISNEQWGWSPVSDNNSPQLADHVAERMRQFWPDHLAAVTPDTRLKDLAPYAEQIGIAIVGQESNQVARQMFPQFYGPDLSGNPGAPTKKQLADPGYVPPKITIRMGGTTATPAPAAAPGGGGEVPPKISIPLTGTPPQRPAATKDQSMLERPPWMGLAPGSPGATMPAPIEGIRQGFDATLRALGGGA